MFKASGRLLFSLIFINQYCALNMISYGKRVLKASRSLLFSLHIINQFVRLMFYYEKFMLKASGGYFLIYSSLISIVHLKCFTTNFIKPS